MASPPYQPTATSPPTTGLSLPRQRPALALPSASARKSSFTSSTSSAHPLRQTSFPPPDDLRSRTRFSPDGDGSLDEFSDSEITSAISVPVSGNDDGGGGGSAGGTGGGFLGGKKRKRGEKRSRGRPPKNPVPRASSASVVNGDDARSTTTAGRRGGTAGAASVVNGDGGEDEDGEEDDEDEGGGAGGRGGGEDAYTLDPAEMEREKQRRTLFRESVAGMHQNRYDAFNKAKLRTQDIRRLVNATLSQSVPPGVTVVVGAYTKMFAGILVELAREVQAEWMAAEVQRPDGKENVAYKRLRLMQPTEPDLEMEGAEDEDEDHSAIKKEDDPSDSPNHKDSEVLPDVKRETDADSQDNRPGDTQPNSDPTDDSKRYRPDVIDDTVLQPGAWGLSKVIDEHDRGPLLPDHLREALRRYKKAHNAGSVGFTGLSLEGREASAPRMGGRRLFR